MTELLFVAVVVLAVLLQDTRRRIKLLERQQARPARAETSERAAAIARLSAPATAAQAEAPVASPPPIAAEPPAAAEPILAVAAARPEPEPAPPPPRPPASSRRVRFEDLAGKQLPIWIGGVALACAAFFLVRYSIELGLFGPLARSLLAALFGVLLLALAELGAKLPRVGPSFAADRRIAQSLAGAGIATLYGTLYMAAELYGLLGVGLGFALVVAVTALALWLSQRHGPPTALLGLAGGYVAPYVAGLPDSSLALTAIYLAVFTGGLLALALVRGWTWLAWCASAASLIWTVSLLVGGDVGELGIVALLVLVIGVGSSWVLARDRPMVRRLPLALPLGAAVLQLAAYASLADFSPLAWGMYGALSAAAIVLARLHRQLLPGVWAALAMAAVSVAGSFVDRVPSFALFLPPLGLALLFGAAGQAFALREPGGRQWAWLGACAPALLLAAAALYGADPVPSLGWGLASLAAALPAAAIVLRADAAAEGDTADVALAVLLAAFVGAAGFLLPPDLRALGLAVTYAGLARWRSGHGGLRTEIGLAALALAAAAMLLGAGELAEIPFRAFAGERWHFQHVGGLDDLLLALSLPAAPLLAAELRELRLRASWPGAGVLAAIALAGFVYAIAKQPLAIASEQAFVVWGFVERALITQALAAAAWAALRDARWGGTRFYIGVALGAVALFRFVWFDLLLLNPVIVRQALAGVPVLNAGTVHAAAMAAWLWAWGEQARPWPKPPHAATALRLASLATMALAVLITVRQLVHGPIVDQPEITRTENYLISAGLLALALAWLGYGIARNAALVRVAGLTLLTLVTLKVFVVDAAALKGLLRVLSFLGLGAALIGIGWAYNRVGRAAPAS